MARRLLTILVACALVVGPQLCCCGGAWATDSDVVAAEHGSGCCSCCPTCSAADDRGGGPDRHPDGSSCPCRAPHKRAVAARDAAAGMPRHQEHVGAVAMGYGSPSCLAIDTVAEVVSDLDSHAGPPPRGGRDILRGCCVLRL